MSSTAARIGGHLAAGRQPRPEDVAAIRAEIQGANPMKVAEVFMALSRAGCMDTEVASTTNRSLRNVRSLCVVYSNPEVRALVAAGQIPVGIAYQAIEDSQRTGLPAGATVQAAIVAEAKRKLTRGSSKALTSAQSQLDALQTIEHSPARSFQTFWCSLRKITAQLWTQAGRGWRGHFGSEIREIG